MARGGPESAFSMRLPAALEGKMRNGGSSAIRKTVHSISSQPSATHRHAGGEYGGKVPTV